MAAPATHDLQSIRSAVQAFVAADRAADSYPASIDVGHLDRRLRLRACGEPLEVAYANPQRRIGKVYSVVQCAAPVRWRIFVPLNVRAFDDVLVARRALPRGHGLTAADVKLEKRELSVLQTGYYKDNKALAQLQTRRPVAAGVALTPAIVAPVKLVRSGESVRVVLQSSQVSVSLSGIALEDGVQGASVRIRNPSSGRVLDAVVTGRSTVTVP